MDSSDAAPEIIAEYSSIFPANYCANAAAVVFIYEYIITIGDEAKYFWKRNLTGATAVFFLNRYVPLTLYALGFANYATMSDESCAQLGKFSFGYGILQLVFWAAFSGSRAFALTNRSWLMLALVGGLSLVPVIVNLIPVHYGLTAEIIPLTGCIMADMAPPDVIKRLLIASRTCIIAADSILILITWSSLFWRDAKSGFTFGKATLGEVLLRDGTIYFVILVVLNVLHLAFSLTSIAVPALQNASNVTDFTNPITAILVQRFLFHLQSANCRALDQDSSHLGSTDVQQAASESLIFNRIIGSMGGSIRPEGFLGTPEDDMDWVEDEQEGEMGAKGDDI